VTGVAVGLMVIGTAVGPSVGLVVIGLSVGAFDDGLEELGAEVGEREVGFFVGGGDVVGEDVDTIPDDRVTIPTLASFLGTRKTLSP
jgi:hypothetical protein